MWSQSSGSGACVQSRSGEGSFELLEDAGTRRLLEDELGDGAGRVDHGCSLAVCGRRAGARTTDASHGLDASVASRVKSSVHDRSNLAVDY